MHVGILRDHVRMGRKVRASGDVRGVTPWSAHEKGACERLGGRWLAFGVLGAAAGGGGAYETQAAGHFLRHRGGRIKGVCVDARGASEDNHTRANVRSGGLFHGNLWQTTFCKSGVV